MKPLKYLFAIATVMVALTISAKADLNFLGAVDFNNGGNSPQDNLDALEAFGVDTTGFVLLTNVENIPPGAGDQTISVVPGEFLVVHYGTGKGGTGAGGSLEFFQVVNGETTVTVPGTGNGPTNPDPFGHGGISSIRGFGPSVPDGGTTVMLLGAALSMLGVARRYLKR
jgi:protein with PEP-CTERM/exosortase system signal